MKTKVLDNKEEMMDIIKRCLICYVGMVDDERMPYVVPFNFGYHGGALYLHGAQTGRKMTILRRYPRVAIAFSTDHELRAQHADTACSYTMKSRSVMMEGSVVFIEDIDEKQEALNIIMRHYTGRDFEYKIPAVMEVACFKVLIEKMSGRVRGY